MTAERAVVVIQARLGSTRLPGKVLADLGGQPILAHVMARAAWARSVSWPLVLTTPAEDAEVLMRVAGAALATRAGMALDWCEHRPPDLLSAFACVAMTRRADVVVRLTADCPLLDPARMDEALALQAAGALDYVALLDPPGTDVEVMTARGLMLADQRDVEREHVGQAVLEALRRDSYETTWAVRAAQPASPWLAVDTAEDLARVRRLSAALEDPTDYSVAATLRAWERAGRP